MEGGDLPELQTAVGVEDEDLPLGVGQGQQRPAQRPGLLPTDQGCFRICFRGCQRQLLVGGVGIAAPAAALPQPGVFADLAEPGVQTAAALKAVDVEKCLVESLLQQLFGLMGVPGQGQEEPVDRLALGLIQFFKAAHGHSSFPMMP